MRFFFIFIFTLFSVSVYTQVMERYQVEETEISYPKKLSVVWANDVFFQTDRYFTNGLELEYHTQGLQNLALAGLLIDPMSESGPVYSLTLTHDIFTPRNVIGDPVQTDRPYAGVLLLGLKATYFSPEKKYRFASTIQGGLLGKYAGGQFVQNGIHVLLPASEPIPGWAFQIRQTFLAQYDIRFEKGIVSSRWIDADLLSEARIGTPYTDFSGGGRIRIGKPSAYFSAENVLDIAHNYVYFFMEATLRTVLYDATLQGGIFTDKNPHTITGINPLVGNMKTGVAARYANLEAEVGAAMFTSKFKNALPHKWVFFKFGILF